MRKWNMWTTKEEEEAENKKKHYPPHMRYNPQVFHYIHVHRVFAGFMSDFFKVSLGFIYAFFRVNLGFF